MGWMHSENDTKQDIIDRLTSNRYWGEGSLVLDYAVVGSAIYIALEADTESNGRLRLIAVALTQGPQKNSPGYAYKTMDETAAPPVYTCPQRLFDLCPCPGIGFSQKWRDKVIRSRSARASSQSRMRQLKAGDRVVLKEGCTPQHLTYIGKHQSPRRRGHLGKADDGQVFQLYPRYIDFERTFAST